MMLVNGDHEVSAREMRRQIDREIKQEQQAKTGTDAVA